MPETSEIKHEQNWYDKYHMLLAIIPVILLIVSLVYLGFFYQKNHDFINKDVSLSGGTTLTLTGTFDEAKLKTELPVKIPDVSFRELSDVGTKKPIAVIIESSAEPQKLQEAVESVLGYKLDETNSSVEFSGSSLSKDFYSQLLKALLISFLLMSLVVFIMFGESRLMKIISALLTVAAISITFPQITLIRILMGLIGLVLIAMAFYSSKSKKEYIYSAIASLAFIAIYFLNYYFIIFAITIFLLALYTSLSIPSIAVIFAAFSDIMIPLAILDFFGMKISVAGMAAFLMLVGYSVDTDILLTTRALKKKEGLLNERIFGAFKTGILMTGTALAAVLPAFFIVSGLPDSFRQIFLILALGLGTDILTTWLTNAGIIKWYCKRRNIQ
jgi:preprotein translocase subunit SecF